MSKHVRVVVEGEEKDKKLGFVYLEGPVTPKPEKAVADAKAKTGKKSPPRKVVAIPVRSVPKVPL